jgi:cbb3-type cytochrome oxidase maturation protein
MEVIYGIIPGMLLLGLLMVGVFFWAARKGQFDDMEGDAYRILMDEDLPPDKPAPTAPREDVAPESKDGQRPSDQSPTTGTECTAAKPPMAGRGITVAQSPAAGKTPRPH